MQADGQSSRKVPEHRASTDVAPSWRIAAYASPGIGLAMLSGPIVVFLPNFYTTQHGLTLGAVGTIFFVARLWDGISDVLVGLASDATRSTWGRRRPWIVFSTPVLCISVLMLLNPPDGAGPAFLFFGLIVTYTAWTAIQVPYMAWGAAISSDHEVRGRIFGMREAATVIGSMGTVVLPYVFTGIASPPLSDVLHVLGFAIVFILVISVPLALTLGPAAANDTPAKLGLRAAVRQVAANGPFMHVLAIAFVSTLALLVFTAGILFFINSALRMQAWFLQLLLIQQAATMLSVPVILLAAKLVGRHRTLAVGCIGAAVGFMCLASLPPENFVLTSLALILVGCSTGALFVLVPALAADAIDYGRLRGLTVQNGLYMSLLSLVMKLGTAVAIAIALPALQLLGFEPAGPISVGGFRALLLVTLALPAVTLLVCAAMAWSNPINRARHDAILNRLRRRDATALRSRHEHEV